MKMNNDDSAFKHYSIENHTIRTVTDDSEFLNIDVGQGQFFLPLSNLSKKEIENFRTLNQGDNISVYMDYQNDHQIRAITTSQDTRLYACKEHTVHNFNWTDEEHFSL